MKKRMRTIGLLVGAALMMTATTFASETQELAGAYEAYEQEGLSEEAREVFAQAMKDYKDAEKLSPLQLLETQIVAGMNYRILCAKTENGVENRVVITIYKDLNGNCEVTNEEKVISPLRYVDLLKGKDFEAQVKFEPSDFDWENKTLTVEAYQTAAYHAGDMASMKVGDLVDVGGRVVTVQSLEESETIRKTSEGTEERAAVIEMNKDTEDAQRFVADEGGQWIAPIENDHRLLAELGKVTLPFAENLKFTDCTDNPGESIAVPYEKLQSYMQEKAGQADGSYGPLNTRIMVEDGKIVSIERTWMP